MSFRFFVDDSLTKAIGNAVNRLGRRQAEFVFRHFGDRYRGGKEENGETPFHARGRDGEEREEAHLHTHSCAPPLLRFLLRFSHCVLSFRVPHLLFHRLFYLGLPSRFCPTRFGAVLLLFWSAVVLSRKGRQAEEKRALLLVWFCCCCCCFGCAPAICLLLSVLPSSASLFFCGFVSRLRFRCRIVNLLPANFVCEERKVEVRLMGSERVLRMGLQLKTKSELALLRSLRD